MTRKKVPALFVPSLCGGVVVGGGACTSIPTAAK
jgi:hypothetical protein